MTEATCLELDEQIDELVQRIGRAPRNRSKRVAKLTGQMERLDGRLYLLEAAHTEARWKARKYRWLPFVGQRWAEQEKQRKLQLANAKAEKKYLKYRLDEAKRRNENYEHHRLEHHSETIELRVLRQAKLRRVFELGHAKAEELRAAGGGLGLPAPGSRAERAWVVQLGKREYAKRVKEERSQRASEFQRRRDEQRRQEEEQGRGRNEREEREEPARVRDIRPTPPTHGWGR